MAPIIPGIRGFPLGIATTLRGADLAQVERTVSTLLEPRRLCARGRSAATDIRVSHVAMGLGHLFGVQHGTAVHTSSGSIRSYQIMVPLRGTLAGRTRRGHAVAAPGEALVYSPRDSLDTDWSEGCVALVLSVPGETLKALARQACPGIDTHTLSLRPRMNLRSGCGRSFANALGTICEESVDPKSAFSLGLTTRSLEQTLLLSLLLAQQDDAVGPMGTSHPSRQACLKRALAVIDTRCSEDIGLADLLRAAGVSARTLQYAFIEQLGVGPITYLKQVRLRRIHDALHRAESGSCAIGDVAARWGFPNGSAFARAYRELFGELPSATLSRH